MVDANITAEQRANLAKLAAYLRTLPVEYPDFGMKVFVANGSGYGWDVAHVAECGTAACAAGHGPVAGIPPRIGETWAAYSWRAFADEGPAWDWCFASTWSETDNTAHGAAARIEWLLENGVPEDGLEQRFGDAPLCYVTEPVQ